MGGSAALAAAHFGLVGALQPQPANQPHQVELVVPQKAPTDQERQQNGELPPLAARWLPPLVRSGRPTMAVTLQKEMEAAAGPAGPRRRCQPLAPRPPALPRPQRPTGSLICGETARCTRRPARPPAGSLPPPPPPARPLRAPTLSPLYTPQESLVLDLTVPAAKETALLELSKKRESFPELAPYLWHSFGTMAALLQEIVSIYPMLQPPSLTAHASNRVCNALALLQCVASHPETRSLFLQGEAGRGGRGTGLCEIGRASCRDRVSDPV